MSPRVRTLSLLLGAALIAGSAAFAPVAQAQAPTRPTVKVKCVSKSTGFARYSRSGSCRRTERVDRKPCAKGGSCVVGDVGPGRGKVFYAARTKQAWGRYLEVAPPTWMADGDPNVDWCDNLVDQSLPGTQATGIGAGKANTAVMVGACTSGAANSVAAYQGGGKSDWYLPSKDELRALFLRQKVSSGFQLHGYWSSSEENTNTAWMQDFYADYTPAPSDKGFANYVRPIRAF
ncbi:MAG: DUF1566 domain-containing protein [Actinomycetales bacterium]|nr:DUF1566 domain-containing protein [Actinomycetales bacterium]